MAGPGWKTRALDAEHKVEKYREALERAAAALWHADTVLNHLIGHIDDTGLETELFWFEHRADDITDVLNGTVTNSYDEHYDWGPLDPITRRA